VAVMYVLLPAALLFAVAAVLVFAWAARSGQFDDLDTPAMRILGEDEEAATHSSQGHADGDAATGASRGATCDEEPSS
jgi:cbb3-type cytochrome oxidase maturation protein